MLKIKKININTAATWLLEALPGIGETKAKAIVTYRETNGPFNHISEIMQVTGIGQNLYDEIKEMILAERPLSEVRYRAVTGGMITLRQSAVHASLGSQIQNPRECNSPECIAPS